MHDKSEQPGIINRTALHENLCDKSLVLCGLRLADPSVNRFNSDSEI